MSLGFSRFGRCVLAGLALSWLGVSHAGAQGTQRPTRFIELSETNNAEILTNLNELTTKKEGFRQLEDQLRTLKGLSSRGAMEPGFNLPYVPPTVSALPNKTLKEILERRQNWALTPEELNKVNGSSESDSMSSDPTLLFGDDKTDRTKSSLQQFYNALNPPGKGQKGPDRLGDNSSAASSKNTSVSDNNINPEDDSSLPPGVRDKAKKLKEMVTEDSNGLFSQSKTRSSFDNFFGLDAKATVPDAMRGPKTSMESFVDQFKRVLDGQSAGARLDPALNGIISTATTPQTAYPLHDRTQTSPSREMIQSTPGNVNSSLERASLPDVNATVLNQWNPLYTPPRLELPKVGPPAPMTMEFPRRKF